ncbi:MAG TPA: acetamidase/formamidase family protein [Thermomicrobiales bacterium]|nr:acetamidase/formamidase family protein [Thermomicrobiales bacterium]HRA30551.1 acetamidase/formamidase family protein [Thermomicrobiales bacterium]
MTVHRFAPDHYFSTIGSHEPALRIGDGDSVETTTIDAGGHDSSDNRIHRGSNPQSGPFYVEGAEPGDALALRLDSIVPNRRRGWSSSLIAERILDPEFVRTLPEPRTIDWDVDVAAGVVTLTDPELEATLGRLALPLEPMIGCFGVAPAGGQAIGTATSAQHGGNMDYRGHRPGVTVIFPVAVPGALFHIGDGHAVQGDGEIAGTGVEISMDVRFTVSIIKHSNIVWPRTIDDDYIMAIGNARPLDEALQAATTELVRWLAADYGLDTRSASTLLGQTIEYDIANVFDPAYTVVAKLNKRWLPAR